MRERLSRVKEILFYNPFEEYLRKRRILAVSLHKGALSFAYLKKDMNKTGISFSKMFLFPEKFPEPAEVVSSVKSVLAETRDKGIEVVFCIPDEWILIIPVRLPVTVLENIGEVLAYEMDRFTPFSQEEVFFDYSLIRTDENELLVALYIVKRETLLPYLRRFESEGIKLNAITFHGDSLAGFLSEATAKRDLLLVRNDNGSLKKVVVYNSLLLGTESCNMDDLLSKPKWIEDFEPEAVVSIGCRLGIDRELSLSDVVYGNLRMSENFPEAVAEATAFSYILSTRRSLDLLSTGIRPQKKVDFRATFFLIFLIVGVLCLMMIIPFIKVQKEVEYLSRVAAELRPKVMDVEKRLKERERIMERINTIRRFKPSYTAVDILKEISIMLPRDTWLTTFVINNNTVRLEGFSDNSTALISILEKSPLLKNVSFSSPTVKDRRLRKERFRIKAEIE